MVGLAYISIVGFIIVFIVAEVLFFPEKAAHRMQLMGVAQGKIGLLEPYVSNHNLETNKEDAQ